MNTNLYTHASYRVTREDGTLVIWDGPYRLPDAPCTLTEAITFIADYCRCDVCEGSGETTCRTCHGDQRLTPLIRVGTDYRNARYTIPCPDCLGRGWTRCPRCKGTGERPCST